MWKWLRFPSLNQESHLAGMRLALDPEGGGLNTGRKFVWPLLRVFYTSGSVLSTFSASRMKSLQILSDREHSLVFRLGAILAGPPATQQPAGGRL